MTPIDIPSPKATILITDDDPTLRAIGAELLGGEGYRVLEAEDGDEALRLIGEEQVDLLILDMLMPNKDGLETIMELRRSGSAVRILAISSGGSMDIDTLLRSAMIFGADRIMSKPLPISSFATTIAEMLEIPAVQNSVFR